MALLEDQNIVRLPSRHQPVVKGEAVQGLIDRLGGKIGSLGLKMDLPIFPADRLDQAKMSFRISRIATVILPVVPEGKWDSIGHIGQEFTGEESRLHLLIHPVPFPPARISPFTGDHRNFLSDGGILGN